MILSFPLLASAQIDGYGIHSGDKQSNCQIARSNALLDAASKTSLVVESKSTTTASSGTTTTNRIINQQSLGQLKITGTEYKENGNTCEAFITVDETNFKQINLSDYEENNNKIKQYLESNGGKAYEFSTNKSLLDFDTVNNLSNAHVSKNIDRKLPGESDQEFTVRVIGILTEIIKQNASMYVSDIRTMEYQGIDLSIYTVNWYVDPRKALEVFKLLQKSGIADKLILSTAMDHVRIKHTNRMYNFLGAEPEGIKINTPYGIEEIPVFYNKLNNEGLYTVLYLAGKHEFVNGAVLTKDR